MRTLDRYILKQYALNFAILLVVLLAMFVLVDLLVNLDEFTQAGEHHARRAQDTGGAMPGQTWFWTLWAIQDYFAPLLLLLFTFLSGLLATAAMGFTFAALVKSGEVLAMLTAGISMFRIAAPVLVAGALANLATLPIKEYLIPPLAHKLLRGQADLKNDSLRTRGAYFTPDAGGNLLSYADLDSGAGVITRVNVLERRDGVATGRRLSAERATWDGVAGGWVLQGVTAVEPDPATGTPRRITLESERISSSLSPDVLLLRRHSRYIQMLSLAQLDAMARNPNAQRYRQPILLAMHSRFSFLVVHVLALLMTLPVFMQREPTRQATLQAIKASVLCVGAWAAALMIMVAGGEHLNAMAAAWLPVALFLPVSVYLLQTTKT